jgi:hypothetical protein
VNESYKDTLGGFHVCFHPMSPSLQTFEISKFSKNLFMDEDGSQANGSQNILHDCINVSFKEQQKHCLKSYCIEL